MYFFDFLMSIPFYFVLRLSMDDVFKKIGSDFTLSQIIEQRQATPVYNSSQLKFHLENCSHFIHWSFGNGQVKRLVS